MEISNSHISNCRIGIKCIYYSSSYLDNNVISNNLTGVYNYYYSSSETSNSHINNNNYGIISDYVSEMYIDNCIIENNIHDGINTTLLSSLEVRNSSITDNGDEGISSCDSPDLVIADNVITDNEGDGISVGNWELPAPYSNVISNNLITNNYNGIYSHWATYPTISYNTITNNENHGIYFRELEGYGNPTDICYNIIYDNGEAGIYTDEYIVNSTIRIFNNTISSNGLSIYNTASVNMELFNNIIFQNLTGISSCEELACLEYNLFWANDTTAVMQIPDGFGDITTQNVNGDSCDIYYNLFLNPLFADPVNDDYHLTGNSPAIDAGNPEPEYIDHDGTTGDIGAFYYDQSDNDENEIPVQHTGLMWNYPNPFNPETTIYFSTTVLRQGYRTAGSGTEKAELEIYNIKGQRIRELKIENVKCKINSVFWDGKDNQGREMPSGVYLYKLSAGISTMTGRMVMIK